MPEEYLRINDCQISVRSTGNAKETIVFVHGSSLSAQGWDDQLSDPLFNNYRLIAFDFPGHGKSERSALQYTLKGLANNLVGVIHSLDLDGYVIVGSSLGSSVIAEAAPLLTGCKGIVLVAPVVVNAELLPENFLIPSPLIHVFTSASPSRKDLIEFIGIVLGNLPVKYHHLVFDMFQQADPDFRTIIGGSLANKEWSDQVQHLRSTGIPLLIIHGENDALIKQGYLNDIKWKLWRDKIHVMKGAGHAVNWDQPALFARLVLEYAAEAMQGFHP